MKVHLYRCEWTDTFYGSRKELIFACDSAHAKEIVYAKYSYRNSITSITITEIPIREVHRISYTRKILVSSGAVYDVPVDYCSDCGNQVTPGCTFCDNCEGYFVKRKE